MKIDTSACIQCGMCESTCPTSSIRQRKDESYVINNKTCIECGICADECPCNAISMTDSSNKNGSMSPSKNVRGNTVNAIIKCPTCGCTYNVVPQDLNNGQLIYHCDSCNNDFQVEFFDHCPRCCVNIGFIETDSFKNDMIDVGIGMLKTAIKPLSGAIHFGEFFFDAFSGKVKDCNGDGLCPICRQRYLRCPSCNELFQISKSAIYRDKYDCPHCGTTVVPCSSIRPGCGGNHSKAFYKK